MITNIDFRGTEDILQLISRSSEERNFKYQRIDHYFIHSNYVKIVQIFVQGNSCLNNQNLTKSKV